MRAREELLARRGCALGTAPVVIAVLGQDAVGLQAVGVHDRAGLGGCLGEVAQRGCGGVGEHLEAQAPGAVAADLDRDSDQHLLSALAPASEAFFVAAEEELVDLDHALEQLTLRGDHRAAQLLEDQPRGLIPRQAELALELLG